ncbi:MAG: shikimate dehydrogenase [Streptococcaceae bacterium]|jgi:shikimate dehydrogenase|nr:shikimate dehydrogenase [Streptococcaceae bacterium]
MITAKTKLAGVIATPIKHSISPLIYNTAFKKLGINAVYLAFETKPFNFAKAIDAIRAFDMLGVNLSMPYKQKALKYMDELGSEVKLVQAMNTVVHEDGCLIGRNTDGIGYIKSLEAKGYGVKGKKITVLGGGGAGIAIIVQLALKGARKISVFNRKSDNFSSLKKRLKEMGEQVEIEIELFNLADEAILERELSNSFILANTTNIGMGKLSLDSPIYNSQVIPKNVLVTDVIYSPKKTKLLQQAKHRGAKTMNGLDMLLYQAAASFFLWTEKKMPIDLIERKLEVRK